MEIPETPLEFEEELMETFGASALNVYVPESSFSRFLWEQEEWGDETDPEEEYGDDLTDSNEMYEENENPDVSISTSSEEDLWEDLNLEIQFCWKNSSAKERYDVKEALHKLKHSKPYDYLKVWVDVGEYCG